MSVREKSFRLATVPSREKPTNMIGYKVLTSEEESHDRPR